jgi:dimethylhistidine N-methyltransferase
MIQVSPSERLQFLHVPSAVAPDTFAASVLAGLSAPARSLSCRWFYDRRGSELFERICELPEYYLTRTERAILSAHAAEIVAALPAEVTLVELGSGSSAKTRLLIEALLDRQASLQYCPVDISAEMLYYSVVDLLELFPRLSVHAIAAEYAEGLARVDGNRGQPRLILFLGSTIGNFLPEEARAFLGSIRRVMAPDDRLLLGADLKKERAIIEPAYNDAAGVTAAFNKNLLVRINSELEGHFDPDAFLHHAPYREEHDRVEMWLVSGRAQEVRIGALDRSFRFAEGEAIHTESCHKYSEAQIAGLAADAGLAVTHRWHDPRRWFALSLLAPAGGGSS